MKKLNDKELSCLERNDLAERLAKAECLIQKKEIEILSLHQKIISHKINEASISLGKLEEQKNHYVDVKRNFVKTIATKHKLSDGWGFCPDSGEIKED